MKYKFSPSLMCMNLLKLEEQIKILNDRADFFHVDIMDGHYVKNITLSPFFIEQIKPVTTLPIDAHLMVENPDDFIDALKDAGVDYISPHAETINKDAFRIINKIKNHGLKVGIVLNPATPVDEIKYYIDKLDKITVMTVDPGFAGQPFIPEMLEKIKELKELKESNGYKYLIEIDGSCNVKTFERLKEAGGEVFIVGSSGLFNKDEDLEKAWEKMLVDFEGHSF
ncbi:D-allulose 6-phosphate 3-epimerase [uncultured Clostridium sp.]|uniref:D-allulose 6-phosphate 3-epimerase n=1 Tax=uncultured Clostridium sp. TaxID=59620 RepID=UPI0028EA7673|nr:D-allulose 6-phosphate 3-epimerase [uncultured Clostridium sp.]